MREGWGIRAPRVSALMEQHAPARRDENPWSEMPTAVDAHLGVVDLPVDLVTSIRCIVRVGDDVVVCTNRHGSHPWPGGRREAGETYEQTACREVLEETGWVLDPSSLRQLGWLRVEYLEEKDDDWPYPAPRLPAGGVRGSGDAP